MSRRAEAFAVGAGEPAPLRWHAAITNPGYEFIVRAAMQDRGIDTVLPLIRYWRVRHRRREVAERPLLARTIIFGMDHSTQDLLKREPLFRCVGEGRDMQMIPTGELGPPVPLRGLERIVQDTGGGWANLPANEVYDLRFAILRGDFDATLREGQPQRPLPDLIRRLIDDGDLPPQAGLTHKEAKRSGLNFSVAA